MSSMTRRAGLRLLAALPIGARAAAEEVRNAGLSAFPTPSSAPPPFPGNPNVPTPMGDYSQQQVDAATYIDAFGVPKHVEEYYRSQAEYISYLDPDIAARRSWSMSVKIITQRERNYQRLVQRARENGYRVKMSRTFEQLTGIRWPF